MKNLTKSIIIIIAIIAVICMYLSPTFVARSYLFFNGHPIASVKANLEVITENPQEGRLYFVDGEIRGGVTGSPPHHIWVKRNFIGMNWVRTAGSGP